MADEIPNIKPKNQAERLLERLGGPRNVCEILKAVGRPRDIATIYKWTYIGYIPSSAMIDLEIVARLEGVVLTIEDYDRRVK